MRPTALQCVRGGLRPHFKPVCSGRRAAGAAPAPAPQRWGLRPRPQIVRGSLFGALRPCLRYAHRWHLPNKPLLRSTADAGMTTGTLLDTGILCRRGAGGTGCGSSGRGRGGDAPRKSPSSGTGAGYPLGVPRKAAQTAPNRLRFLRSGARGQRAPQKPEQRHRGRVPFGRAAQSSPNRPEPAAVPPVGGTGATRPAKARAAARGRRGTQKHPTKQRHTLIQNPPNAMYQKRLLKRSSCMVYFWAEKAPNMYHLETDNPPRQPSKSGFPVVFKLC